MSTERFCGFVRRTGVTVRKLLKVGASRMTMVGCVMGGLISWKAAVLALAILTVNGAIQVIVEWQQRRTFMAQTGSAPPGTVIVQQAGPAERQSMTVTLGGHLRPPRHGDLD